MAIGRGISRIAAPHGASMTEMCASSFCGSAENCALARETRLGLQQIKNNVSKKVGICLEGRVVRCC